MSALSSNAFANGSNQNSGNVITDRSSTRLHAPPGGTSQICFGSDEVAAPPSAVHPLAAHNIAPGGSGHYARATADPRAAAAQNHRHNVSSQISFGDASTTEPAPQPRAAPQPLGVSVGGGGSEMIFGQNARKGSNAYANGGNQNCGNVISDRSTTRLHAPSGGTSQISFGDASTAAPAPQPRAAPQSLGSAVAAAPAPYQQPQQQQQQTSAAAMTFGANARKGSNAYANGGNQNCGNVLTDRPTTRLHAPPGGASQITLG